MYKIFYLLLLLSIFSRKLFAQNTTDQSTDALNGRLESHVQEKLYIHIDRPSYLAGETMWFKINIVDGRNHKPLNLSKVVYLELSGNRTSPTIQAKIAISKGFGNGAIYLPLTLKSGKYKVGVYKNWMKNFGPEHFFEQAIFIVNTIYNSENVVSVQDSSLNIQFFPEQMSITKVCRFLAFFIAQCMGTRNKDTAKPDHRNLLFWEPSITIVGTETMEISFYTADLSGKYIRVLQGIGDNRNAGHFSFSFEVKDNTISEKKPAVLERK